MFKLTIETDNAAFGDDDGDDFANAAAEKEEVARILAVISHRVLDGESEGRILDANGNSVGGFKFE